MFKNLLLPIFCLLFLITACKKKENCAPDNTGSERRDSVSQYMPLKPGNYWIYESYRVDSNGIGVPGTYTVNGPSVFDSIYVASDTSIAGLTYHRLMKPRDFGANDHEALYLRDSLEYIVGLGGGVELALYDSVSVFLSKVYLYPNGPSDDSALAVSWRKGSSMVKSVPAGSFNTTAMMYEWSRYPFAAASEAVTQRRQHVRYAKNVGVISETMSFYIGNPDYIERRLVRYHVQ